MTKKIKSVRIFWPTNYSYYEIGAHLMDGEKELEITVKKIEKEKDCIKVTFSNKEIIEFHSNNYTLAY